MRQTAFVAGIVFLGLAAAGCSNEFDVRELRPAVGVLGGGEPVEILGSGFRSDMGFTVYIGTTKADNVVVKNSGVLTVTTPASSKPGLVDVRVLTDDGKEIVVRKAFRYVEKAAMDIRDLGARKSLRGKQQ